MAVQSTKVAIVYFSPTGSGKTIAMAIEKYYFDAEVIDITNRKMRLEKTDFSHYDITFFIAPTYAQTIPKIIKKYLKTIKYSNFFVPITMYGNISYGISLKTMTKIAKNGGANIIGGAAFVGAHSYNNKEQKISIAVNRPDEDDLKEVNFFCQLIKMRLEGEQKKIRITGFRNPLAFLIPERLANFAVSKPEIQKEKCQNCNLCQHLCPVEAIDKELNLDSKCLKCYACASKCPEQARIKKIRFPLTRMYLAFFGRKRKNNKII